MNRRSMIFGAIATPIAAAGGTAAFLEEFTNLVLSQPWPDAVRMPHHAEAVAGVARELSVTFNFDGEACGREIKKLIAERFYEATDGRDIVIDDEVAAIVSRHLTLA